MALCESFSSGPKNLHQCLTRPNSAPVVRPGLVSGSTSARIVEQQDAPIAGLRRSGFRDGLDWPRWIEAWTAQRRKRPPRCRWKDGVWAGCREIRLTTCRLLFALERRRLRANSTSQLAPHVVLRLDSLFLSVS
jgi:hypothetical protein